MTISYHQRSAALTEQPGEAPRPGKGWRLLRLLLILVASGLLLAALTCGGALYYGWKLSQAQPQGKASSLDGKSEPSDPAKLAKSIDGMAKKLTTYAPREPYIVIDTALNRVYWRSGTTTLREMVASCGSGNVLEDPATGRRWTFDTPRGEHKVQVKKVDPVWIKPDWAFIEEGEIIPKDGSGRSEPGMMGDYALGIGQGYYIHGTLYKRLLGRNVSHGCVRLGDEDLEFLYKNANFGTRVIIY